MSSCLTKGIASNSLAQNNQTSAGISIALGAFDIVGIIPLFEKGCKMPIQGKHDDTDWMVEYETDSGDTDFLSVTSSSNEKLARDHIQRIFDLHNRNPDSPDQRELVSIKPGN